MTTASENPKPVTAYCRTCGKALTEDTVRVALGTVFCEEHVPKDTAPVAGAASPYTAANIPNPGVSPGLAFLLGLLPGVGAIYNGQYAKGLVHVLILGLAIAILNNGTASGGLEPLFGMLIAVFWFYMAFEAYHTARKRMMGEPVDEFSSLIQVSGGGGRVPALPIALIVLGVLFLMNNLGLLRLGEVLRFWPVGLIGVGAWMLWGRVRSERSVEAGVTGEAPRE
jgi:hypothetical protein